MLQYTTTGEAPRFGFIVHHADADREWAYDWESSVGWLDRVLDDAEAVGWNVIDRKSDWNRIFLQ